MGRFSHCLCYFHWSIIQLIWFYEAVKVGVCCIFLDRAVHAQGILVGQSDPGLLYRDIVSDLFVDQPECGNRFFTFLDVNSDGIEDL